MSEQCCQSDPNLDFNILCKKIILDKNIGCLKELNDLSECIVENNIEFDPLNSIIIYYLYFIWIPDDLRGDLKSIGYLITKDFNRIIKNYMSNPEFLEINLEESDIYTDTVNSLVNDILYRYTGGLVGRSREDKSLYKILLNMFKINYSTINDDYLKILFMGYYYFNNELFSSVGERELFKFFLYNRRSMATMDLCACGCPDEEVSFENKANEMNLI